MRTIIVTDRGIDRFGSGQTIREGGTLLWDRQRHARAILWRGSSTKKTRDDLIANVPSYEHYDLIFDASASQRYSNAIAVTSRRLCTRLRNHRMIGRLAIHRPILELMQTAR
jgi:hypothetical protein